MQTLDLLFVYGSLMTGNTARQNFRPYLEHLGEGRVNGRLYHLPEGYPTLILEETAGPVVGEVLRLSDPARALAELDDYEGADPKLPRGGLYARVRTMVRLEDGDDVAAWIYVCPDGGEAKVRDRGRLVQSGSWRAFLSGS